LAGFLNQLQGEKNEAVRDDYRSIMQNMPSIPGYTALQSQITTIANGNGAQKSAGQYVRFQFLGYQTSLNNLWADQLTGGYNWIKD